MKPFTLVLQVAILIAAHVVWAAPTITWLDQIVNFKTSVQSQENEVAAYFVQIESPNGHTSFWSPAVGGNTVEVKPPSMDKKTFQQLVARYHPSKVRFCHVHTHPRASARVIARMSESDRISSHYQGLEQFEAPGIWSMPPSPRDVRFTFDLQLLSEGKVKTEELGAVVDSMGVWYFQKFSSEKDRDQFVKTMRELIGDAIDLSGFPRFDTIKPQRLAWMTEANANLEHLHQMLGSAPYDLLRLAYASENVRLRFVPFEALAADGPCRGFE